MADKYDDMSLAELQAEASNRTGVAASGTKADLAARLRADDEGRGQPAQQSAPAGSAEQAAQARQDAAAADEPKAPPEAYEHPLASPDSPQGFTEVVTDPHVQGSTELPASPEDLEERAETGIPSVQEGAPAQVRRDDIAEWTGGAGEPYVGHGDDQPGDQPDPMAGRRGDSKDNK